VLQHLPRDVSGNVPDGFVARSAFRKVGNQGVPVIVPPSVQANTEGVEKLVPL
jgi:hypothetical protein